jgi:Flp pilus assembly protein CpaB
VMQSDRIQFDSPLQPFDRVDIIVSKRKDNGKDSTTQVFMKDVLVGEVYNGAPQKQSDRSILSGVGLDVPLADAVRLIDMENYAEHIRILKADNQKPSK